MWGGEHFISPKYYIKVVLIYLFVYLLSEHMFFSMENNPTNLTEVVDPIHLYTGISLLTQPCLSFLVGLKLVSLSAPAHVRKVILH